MYSRAMQEKYCCDMVSVIDSDISTDISFDTFVQHTCLDTHSNT